MTQSSSESIESQLDAIILEPAEWKFSDYKKAKAQILQLINTATQEAKEEGRKEVYEAIEDNRLVLRRFMTREQVKQEFDRQSINLNRGEKK